MAVSELARVTLPAVPESVSEARAIVAAALDGRVDAALHHDALVVVTELCANAMLHAATPFEVVVARIGADVRLEVHDGEHRLPRRKRYSDHATTGRGLLLVEALTTVAGAEQTESGKVVWAVLSEAPPGPPAVSAAAEQTEAVAEVTHLVATDVSTVDDTRVAAKDETWDLRSQAWCEQHRLAPV
jgi:anti-sigma regulatory factor (Ser/Thr protein kinase)